MAVDEKVAQEFVKRLQSLDMFQQVRFRAGLLIKVDPDHSSIRCEPIRVHGLFGLQRLTEPVEGESNYVLKHFVETLRNPYTYAQLSGVHDWQIQPKYRVMATDAQGKPFSSLVFAVREILPVSYLS